MASKVPMSDALHRRVFAEFLLIYSCFFFQAEDGIRDSSVTGVQTCALPISSEPGARLLARWRQAHHDRPHRVDRDARSQIGRASCRERVEISVVAVSLKKKNGDERR